MPELAEVEYYRKQWDPGLRQKILRVASHREKRVFRETKDALLEALPGTSLLGSEARAKHILFRFSRGIWVGIHLGMTGRLSVEREPFSAGVHDHLVLFQKQQALVFHDPRQFGRIRLHEGKDPPGWWTELPPAILSAEWTESRLQEHLSRRIRLAIKAALLDQTAFPGIGNWMADEILWRARINPAHRCGDLSGRQSTLLWKETREVCRVALETVAAGEADPPADWFFHERWSAKGHCPRDGAPLKTATIGGRTTRWCGRCQR